MRPDVQGMAGSWCSGCCEGWLADGAAPGRTISPLWLGDVCLESQVQISLVCLAASHCRREAGWCVCFRPLGELKA